MGYDLILTDNPWKYFDEKSNLPKLGGKTYPTMTDAELGLLPIHRLVDDNALLLSWFCLPKLQEGLDNMRAWGFKPVTCLLTWIKLNRRSHVEYRDKDIILHRGAYSGLGSYTAGNIEIVYLGKRGKGIPRASKSVKQLIFAPLRGHSQKPREQYDRIEELYPEARKLELFARKENPPPDWWDATGYDYDGKSIEQFLTEQGAYEGREDHSKNNGGRVEQTL